MRIGYLDCNAGVAGDMFVAALLDAGLDLAALRAIVASLDLPGVSIAAGNVLRAGLRGTRFTVDVAPPHAAHHHHHDHAPHSAHRHLADVLAVVERAAVPASVRDQAAQVFRLLAASEARAHDLPIEAVHFHELGGEDTIVDVVCACAGVHLLGIERLYASAVATGSGTVHCEHGELPVPAPGALGVLFGVPIRSGGLAGERTTPTGAALLKVLVTEFEPRLVWVPTASGYGAGTRDDPDHPNLLRLTLGVLRDPGAATTLSEIACNLDTATGEEIGSLITGMLARGATDAFATPLQMKKGRPGWCVSALVDTARRDDLVRFLLEESSTLGVRMHAVERAVLERWVEEVDTDLGRTRCKVTRLPSGRVVKRPEADEVDRLALAHSLSRRAVLARILRQIDGG